MAITEGSRIKNPYYAQRLVDFQGLELDDGIYPTDLDALIEYHDTEYILIEVKFEKAKVPYGQRLAIQRMVDDFTKAGKRAIALVAEHYDPNPRKPIIAADCIVRELYYGEESKWREPTHELTVREAVDCFRGINSETLSVENTEPV